MSKKVSIIGGVLGGLGSLIPEAGRQITGGGGKSKQRSTGGGGGTLKINNYYKIGNTFHTKHEHIKKKDEYKYFTTHNHFTKK